MSAPPEPLGLEIQDDRAFQERWWFFERIGWAIMALVICAALVGLTGGGGLLSRGHAEAGDATIDYPRIARLQAADVATIAFAPGTAGLVEVHLPEDFLNVFAIEQISPAPYSVVSTPGGQILTFEVSGGAGTSKATLSLRPSRSSLPKTVRARVGTARPVDVSFVVLP